ncbi:MAG TPA: Xaa-Pro peptidase family protein [Gemmatimonadaceae bacterium]
MHDVIRDQVRTERIVAALRHAGLDALVCARPANVLLVSGYWPVVGTAIAVATRDGRVGILAPEDERELAERSHADLVATFAPGSTRELRTAAEAAREPLAALVRDLGLTAPALGCDAGEGTEPASYAAMHLYGEALGRLARDAGGALAPCAGDQLLARLRARLTEPEVRRVEHACAIAEHAFRAARRAAVPGASDREVAAAARAPLSLRADGAERADGFVWCMSGAESARASAAYARTGDRRIAAGDLVLVHCNSYVDGYWTDITRTFTAGEPGPAVRDMYDAVLEARDAALAEIRPGVTGRAVDAAARAVLERRGYGAAFRHATGHGVGFAAIDHDARPRLHPASSDILEPGMTCNVEPAIYLDDIGGLRHCDVVTITTEGARVLTPFLASARELART